MHLAHKRKLEVAFVFAFSCLIGLGGFSYWTMRKAAQDHFWVQHTVEVIGYLDHLSQLQTLLDLSHEAYVLTSKDGFLRAHQATMSKLEAAIRELVGLTRDNTNQQQRLQSLEEVLNLQQLYFNKSFELVSAQKTEEIPSLAAAMGQAMQKADFNSLVAELEAVERALEKARIENTKQSNRLAYLLLFIGSCFAALALAIARRSIIGDLRARSAAALAIRESQERFDLVAQATQDIVWDWDLGRNEIWWNDCLYKRFSYEKADIGVSADWWVDRIHPGDRESVLSSIQIFIDHPSAKHWTGAYRFQKKDGSYANVLDRGFLIRGPDGKAVRMIGSMLDISEQKTLEKELIEAREKAIESSHLKSEFLANMSHEIRTPMNGVIGMTGLLLETKLDPMQMDYAQTIRGCADSLLTVINDILDFSKIEAGKLSIERSDFELRPVVESCLELLAPTAHQKGLELLCAIETSLPFSVIGDAGRIRQLLTNLIGNAAKFTHKGEILLEVNSCCTLEGESRVRFAVTDTGIGISAAQMQKLFQAFSQADGSTARKYGGTGLGLAISKQLVELMGGRIGVESELGKGSTFWFELPLPTGSLQNPKGVRVIPNLKQHRCLIVDDNETNRRIVQGQLDSWDMQNTSVSTPFEALQTLRAAAAAGESFDLVVLDMQMPEMSGIELAQAIKGEPSIPRPHLVMMSSSSQAVAAKKLREIGVGVFLTKPVRQSQLYNSILEVLSDENLEGGRPQAKAVPQSVVPVQRTQKSVRVLIAEDNAINQKIALSQLDKLGYRAEAVGNGIEALAASQAIPYDIILMDCQMPEMDGYEATRRLRAREGQSRHTVIIAMTANAIEGDREKCLAAGMDDYIGKPVNIKELESKLQFWAGTAKAS